MHLCRCLAEYLNDWILERPPSHCRAALTFMSSRIFAAAAMLVSGRTTSGSSVITSATLQHMAHIVCQRGMVLCTLHMLSLH